MAKWISHRGIIPTAFSAEFIAKTVIVVFFMLFIATPAAAMVTVTGNTISWPDDGWYQVQNRQTQEIICQGARSCVVADGIYEVQRFTNSSEFTTSVVVGNPADLSLTAEAFASAIRVSGRTISWSVGGWYQVQSTDTLQTICNGDPTCTVPSDGRYIVINHSLGLRSEVEVGSGGTSSGGSQTGNIQVNGNVITWPDNGWYQVQRADNFQEVCMGGRQCSVTPGTYIVINHTLEQRYNNITVRGSATSGGSGIGGGTSGGSNIGSSVITVEGNRISWPDNGWYQVQRADNFATICQGVRFCNAPAGEYIVINHSLGQRFTGITVSGDGSDGPPDINSENSVQLFRQAFEVLNGQAYDSRFINAGELNPSAQGLAVISTSTDPSTNTPITEYSCINGGTVTQNLQGFGVSTRVFTVSYSNCQIGGDTINGTVIRDLAVGNNDNIALTFQNYELTFEPAGRMTVDGFYQQITGTRSTPIVGQNLVDADLDYFFTFSGGSLNLANLTTNYSFILSRAPGGLDQSVTRRTASTVNDFIMQPPGFDTTFRVSVIQPLGTSNTRDDRYFSTGQIRIRSEFDGSTAVLDPASGDITTVNIRQNFRGNPEQDFTFPWSFWDGVFRFR